MSSPQCNQERRPKTRLEVEVTFEVRSFCECCESELEWCKEFIEVRTPIDLGHIKLWFESGAALGDMRRLLRAGIPPRAHLWTLRSAKKRARITS